MPETDIEDKDHPKKGIRKIFSIFNIFFISHTYFNNDNKQGRLNYKEGKH
ncbi:Protein of unknown function [Bacillus cereus]|nr:Protein of unknown function [Bacillus cereus]